MGADLVQQAQGSSLSSGSSILNSVSLERLKKLVTCISGSISEKPSRFGLSFPSSFARPLAMSRTSHRRRGIIAVREEELLGLAGSDSPCTYARGLQRATLGASSRAIFVSAVFETRNENKRGKSVRPRDLRSWSAAAPLIYRLPSAHPSAQSRRTPPRYR
jgi:hypothetical protein